MIILILLKRLNSDYALLASCLINISITVLSFGFLIPVFDYIKDLAISQTAGRLTTVLFKSAGICLLCSIGAEICADCGEATLSKRIELAGKCTLIAYSLPLIREVFSYAASFMD